MDFKVFALGKHFEGTLRPYVEQVNYGMDQVEAITDRIQISAEVAERVVKKGLRTKTRRSASPENGTRTIIRFEQILHPAESTND